MQMPIAVHHGLRAKAADAEDEQNLLDDLHGRLPVGMAGRGDSRGPANFRDYQYTP